MPGPRTPLLRVWLRGWSRVGAVTLVSCVCLEQALSSASLSYSLFPTDCERYYDPKTEVNYLYWYPENDSTQYLYESYPKVVSPIEGVENEHFIVWMRTAGLPTFRKLFGKIHHDLKKGDTLSFDMDLNFEVDSFDGSKALVLSTLGDFGGKNSFLGISYVVVGSISLLLGLLFALKQAINPRQLGDTRFLGWNN